MTWSNWIFIKKSKWNGLYNETSLLMGIYNTCNSWYKQVAGLVSCSSYISVVFFSFQIKVKFSYLPLISHKRVQNPRICLLWNQRACLSTLSVHLLIGPVLTIARAPQLIQEQLVARADLQHQQTSVMSKSTSSGWKVTRITKIFHLVCFQCMYKISY